MTHPDDRPPHHLTVVDEPPYDPTYDPGYVPPTSARTPPHHVPSEQAVLKTLLVAPEHADRLVRQLDGSDFYRPIHEQLWDAWHALHAADGVPPDAITFQAHLMAAGQVDAVQQLVTILALDASPNLADQYARTVRDTARLRTVDDVAAGLHDLVRKAKADQIESYLGEALQRLDETVMRFGPRDNAHLSGLRDLSWILTGQAPEIEPPVWVRHEAGHALFYAGKVNGVFGDPETAKTWLAQIAIIEALHAGGTAAMVDVDHNGENHTAARLMLLGGRPEVLADPERFRYYDPQDGAEFRAAIDDITLRHPDVVLVDSLGEVFPMLGLNSNDNDELTGGLRLISRPADAGSCVIFIDHLPKGTEARASGFAIGAIAKKRAIRGSYIRAEESVKPSNGQVGKVNLFLEKDTSSGVRQHTPGGKYIGKFVLDSTLPHVTTWAILRDDAPTDASGRKRYTRVMERISRFIEDNDQCTGNEIKAHVGGKTEIAAAAIKTLIEEGFVSVHRGRNNAHLHHSIALYREAEDDNAQPDS